MKIPKPVSFILGVILFLFSLLLLIGKNYGGLVPLLVGIAYLSWACWHTHCDYYFWSYAGYGRMWSGYLGNLFITAFSTNPFKYNLPPSVLGIIFHLWRRLCHLSWFL
jgi:hypothetical protein